MKLLLTSFGIDQPRGAENIGTSPFYKLPPLQVSADRKSFFAPDYAALLMADELVMDGGSFERLQSGSSPLFGPTAGVYRRLHKDGFLRLEDCEGHLSAMRPTLESMVDDDLTDIDAWIPAMRESFEKWRSFLDAAIGQYGFKGEPPHAGPVAEDIVTLRYLEAESIHLVKNRIANGHALMEFVGSDRYLNAPHFRELIRDELRMQLSHINASLLLSREYGVGFYDWADFDPYYRKKFSGSTGAHQGEIGASRELFSIAFPEYGVWNADGLARALADRRIGDLRSLVKSAIRGEVEFDREFAVRTLREVLAIERGAARTRTLISYITQPLGLIPVVGPIVQKVAEEIGGLTATRKMRTSHEWFYLISDFASSELSVDV